MMKEVKLRAVMVALLLASSGEAVAQAAAIWVDKTRVYDQGSATGVAPKPAQTPCNFNCGFAFSARVSGPNLSGISPPTVAGPIDTAALGSFWNGGAMGYEPSGNWWVLGYPPAGEWNSPTQADLDAKFGNGVYTLTVQGQAYPVNLTGDAYPSPPVMRVEGTGNWSNGKFVFDPRFPLTVTNPGASPGVRYVGLYGCVPGGGCPFHAGYLNLPASFTVPANTISDGTEFFFVATDTLFVDEHFGPAGAPPQSYASYNARTQAFLKAEIPQRFPVVVTNANITPTTATVSATFQPLPEDVGTTASVFVFALAPAARVTGAVAQKSARFGAFEKDKADAQAGCVLAQLRSDGRLGAVSASNMQAYVSGVLSGQHQAVQVLNGVPTANVGGATFYIGYGASSGQMLGNGKNQRAITVPGSDVCDPKPPQTGWWWNPVEPGRGYTVEVSGINLAFAAYLYDTNGRAMWYWASGATSLDGALFTGDMLSFSQGPTLSSAFRLASFRVVDSITLAFSNPFVGTLAWPGGVLPVERFEILPGGLALAAKTNQPEAGWWWDPKEPRRGFFLEWQGGQLYMAGYMYDDRGDPIWYLSTNTTPSSNLLEYDGVWWSFGNGQTLTGAWRPHVQLSTNAGPVTIRFNGATRAAMTLPGGRTLDLERYRF